jgi:divalent metal cation (Fe/Co/Zn/Cd) transporter
MKRFFQEKLIVVRDYLSDKQQRNNRIALFAKISIITNAVMALGKIGMSIYSLSLFLFAGGLFNVGIGVAKAIAVKGYSEHEKKAQEHGHRCYYLVGCVVIAASLAYMAYSFRMMNGGQSNIQFDLVTALSIATFTFVEIGTTVYGIVKIRRDKEPIIEAIKMTNLVSALISIVLTQAALLSLENVENAAMYCGIAGLVFGGISVAVGFYMMFRIKSLSKETNALRKKYEFSLGTNRAMDYGN